MIQRIAAAIVVCLLVAATAQAQVQMAEWDSLPAPATLQWDAAVITNPTTQRVDGYRVFLDGTLVATTNSITATSASFTVPTFGRHTLTLKAFNASFESVGLDLAFDLAQKITLSVPPNGSRLVLVIQPVAAATGTAAPFTDAAGHKWVLVGTDPQIDGKHAGNAGAAGTQLILLPSGVYVLAIDSNWYKWSGTDWTLVGKTRPTS